MGLLRELPRRRSRDLAIDLGTANTLVYVDGRGIVVSEPSVIALDGQSGAVHAVGDEARRMIGRTPATISATRPLRHGVIADFDVTEQMLRYFMQQVDQGRFAHPRLVMCAPSGITDVEKRAVEEACLSAGAKSVELIEEAIAAAIGAGLPIEEPTGRMVVDVGGGTTEMAVISLGGIVSSRSLRVGGYDLDEAILAHVRRRYKVAIGQPTAERLKFELGSAYALDPHAEAEVRGVDLVSGLPKAVVLSSDEIRVALADPVQTIVEAVKGTLEETPPELSADIATNGIVMTGGGALLHGLVRRLAEETGMGVSLVDEPLTCVVTGAGKSLRAVHALSQAKASRRGTSRRRQPRVADLEFRH